MVNKSKAKERPKPKQIYEINFQEDISEQLGQMTANQLIKIFFAVFSMIPLSFELMSENQEQFKEFMKVIGSVLAVNVKRLSHSDEIPDIETLTEISSDRNLEVLFPFITSFFTGLSGTLSNKILTQSLIESIRKLVVPDYNSLSGWRDSLIIYVRSHSKATATTLSNIVSHPTYWQLRHFLRKFQPKFSDICEQEDVITTFDNEQKLKKSYRIGGAEGSNKMSISLCTMVLHLYPAVKTNLQFMSSLSPAKWLWNRTPQNFTEDKVYSKTVKKHKENWWNNVLKEVFNYFKSEESEAKKIKIGGGNDRIENRRQLYEFAVSEHPEKPAEIVVGQPHDLNPSSYEDTKKIIRNESIKAGISKYGNGKRSWLALVCDGSPFRLFLSLFNVLFFCKICKLPCGELKKHIDEVHGGKTDSVRMEFDHI